MDPHILILAAGAGKRMNSQRPKALHPVLFRPMIHYVLELASAVPNQSISVVVGQGEEEIRKHCAGYRNINFIQQELPLGTAHAVRAAESFLRFQKGPVLVLSGDVILLEPESLRKLLEWHQKEEAACTIGTSMLPNPSGYGRIIRRIDGQVADVRESADCSSAEKRINEVNAGIYVFSDITELLSSLAKVTDDNANHEYYIADVVKFMTAENKKVIPYSFGDSQEVMGIEDRYSLWKVEAVLQERVNRVLQHRGVTIQDPKSTFIDPRCRIEPDVVIEAGCVLINSVVEAGVVVEAHSRLVDSVVGPGTLVKQGSYVEDSVIGRRCVIGPYAHLRPNSRLGADVKIGNFVETKNVVMGSGSKASHLSYIGDAEIGKDVNIGCGFITCNYDGTPEKRKTIIEDGAFIGSDCQTVAPVTVGAGSYVAAGTTVTENVPPGSLAISRGRQTTKEGYAKKYPKKSKVKETINGDAAPIKEAGSVVK